MRVESGKCVRRSMSASCVEIGGLTAEVARKWGVATV